MKKFLLAFVLLLFLAQSGFSQGDQAAETSNSGSSNFYLLNGIHSFSLKSLNDAIVTAGFTKVKNGHNSYGAGAFGSIERFVVGGEGYNTSNEQRNDSSITRSQGGLGLFYFGFKVINRAHFDVYPMLGAGFGGLTVSLIKDEPDMAFSNFLNSPQNAGQIGIGAFMFDLSICADYRLNKKNTMFLGFRGGYNFSRTTEWNADNFKIIDSPKDSFANTYFELILGVSIGNDAAGF